HSKFGRPGLVQVCGFSGLTEIVTDRPPPADIAAALAEHGVCVGIAEAG
ncbi:MAG: DeoR/GlpR transcriptional regulator, partial [Rhizobiaceae bacterium]|nr:DeoR/GlpR transcriptional regulator [Rhizobiaceae bacterium]